MANRVKITGKGKIISLGEKHVTRMVFDSNVPNDSNARASDLGIGIKVWGKILFDSRKGTDPTVELAKWSQIPSYHGDCYRRLEAEVISAGQIVRQFTLAYAFVVEYSEELNVETGVGTFYLHARQKKDDNEHVAINGGFAAD